MSAQTSVEVTGVGLSPAERARFAGDLLARAYQSYEDGHYGKAMHEISAAQVSALLAVAGHLERLARVVPGAGL